MRKPFTSRTFIYALIGSILCLFSSNIFAEYYNTAELNCYAPYPTQERMRIKHEKKYYRDGGYYEYSAYYNWNNCDGGCYCAPPPPVDCYTCKGKKVRYHHSQNVYKTGPITFNYSPDRYKYKPVYPSAKDYNYDMSTGDDDAYIHPELQVSN